MKTNEYNDRAADFKQKAQEQEVGIIEGNIFVHDLREFTFLHEEVDRIVSEYLELVNAGKEQYRAKLEEYLKEELDYLDLIVHLMEKLTDCHAKKTDITSKDIEHEWDDVRVLITTKNIEKALKRAEALKDRYPKEKHDELVSRYNSLLQKAVAAESNLLKRSEHGYESATISEKDKVKLTVNEEVLDSFDSVYEKIDYVETFLASIERSVEDSETETIVVNGEKKEIRIEFVSIYLSYVDRLNNLYLERDLKEERFEDLSKKIESQVEEEMDIPCIDSYWEVKEDLSKYQAQLKEMISHVSLDIPNEKTINVTLYNGKSARILKKDLVAFENLEAKIKESFIQLEDLMVEHGVEVTVEKKKNINKKKSEKQEIIEEIRFLKESGEKGEALEQKIQELIKEYSKVEKRKIFTTKCGLNYLFRKQGFDKEEAKSLADISYKAKDLQKNKEIADEDKKSIFKTLKDNFTEFMKSTYDEAVMDFFNDEEMEKAIKDEPKVKPNKYAEKALQYFENAKTGIKESFSNVLKAIKELPKKDNNYVSKIKNMKKSKNKSLLKENVKKKGMQIAFILGTSAILAANAKSGYVAKDVSKVQKNVEADAYDEKKPMRNPFDTMEAQAKKAQEDQFNLNKNKKISFDEMIDKANQKSTIDHKNTRTSAGISSGLYDMIDSAYDDNYNLAAGVTDQINRNISSAEIDNKAEELGNMIYERANISLGDTFTVDENAQIYANEYDVINDVNALKPYYGLDSEREVTGIAYNFNGNIVVLDENDPNFESQRAFLESNGATLEAVRSQNRSAEESGVEGYWDIDDINLERRAR